MRSVVLIHGLLSGMGREAVCEMLAMKEPLPHNSQTLFSRCSVIEAPQDLPDGDYTVSFSDYIVSTKKECGLWLPAGDAVEVGTQRQPAKERSDPFQVEDAGEILPLLKRPTGRVA
jgi:hypothetical protein